MIKFFKSRSFFVFVGLLLCYLIFLDALLPKFDIIFVDSIFCKLKPGVRLDLAFTILSIFSIGYFIDKIVRSISLNWKVVLLVLIITITYSYYRYGTERYQYRPYFENLSVMYSDYLILVGVLCLFVFIVNTLRKRKLPSDYNLPFLVDLPIQGPEKDILNRKKFAKLLANRIQSIPKLTGGNKAPGALAIGITGRWGAGKTSFINMVNSYLDRKNRIILNFNPWLSNSPEMIIDDFFEQLAGILKPVDVYLSTEIQRYGKELSSVDGNIFSKSAEAILNIVNGQMVRSRYYSKINTALEQSKMQLIIFVDDLDRLDSLEVIEVLRLIRNTANFANTVYVVTYDKEYVNSALKKVNEYGAKTYLQKIFQFEFDIPPFKSHVLMEQLKHALFEGLHHEVEESRILELINLKGKNGRTLLSVELLKTPRSLIRFTNSFLHDINLVRNDVNLRDFYLVQLLKYNHYDIYRHIAENWSLYFRSERNMVVLTTELYHKSTILGSFQLRVAGVDDSTPKLLDLYLDELKDKSDINEIKEIIQLLLIPEIANKNKDFIEGDWLLDSQVHENRDIKCFAFFGNFQNYFTLNLLDSDFPVDRLNRLRCGNFVDYESFVKEWLNKGHYSEISLFFEEFRFFDTMKEWENHLSILKTVIEYSFAEHKQVKDANIPELIRTISFPCNNGVVNIFFPNNTEYKAYLARFFTNAEEPYIPMASVLHEVLNRKLNDFILNSEEIHTLFFNYIYRYCKGNELLDRNLVILRNLALKVPNDCYRTENKLKIDELFRKHVKTYLASKDLDFFIDPLKDPTFPNNSYVFDLHIERVNLLFESLEEFINFLNDRFDLKEDLYYEEFNQFYNKLRKDPDQSTISFTFQLLEPTRW